MKLIFLSLLLMSITACSVEVGSEQWCAKLQEKPKGDWTANEAADYAKYCLFK
jgi:hypothetical protein